MLNAELYVIGNVWEEHYGEWQLEDYPVSIESFCKCLFEGVTFLDGNLSFKVYDSVENSSEGDQYNYTITHYFMSLTELVKLFYENAKDNISFAEGKVIVASLSVPYRDKDCDYIEVPIPLTNFFDLLSNQYYKPKVKIEDIPF